MPTTPTTTHEVLNQVPPLEGRNLFADHAALQEALQREGGGWARERLHAAGAFWGGEPMRWGVEANEHPPVLHTHDRFGHRRDEVEFHPAWHALMRAGVEQELHALPWRTDQPGAHVARAATYVCSGQAEAGFGCPITMTFAAVPALRTAARPRRGVGPAADRDDLRPATSSRRPRRPARLCGMAMTEKQGGSDVRANTTRARSRGDDGWWELTGHKWFCSAPMCDLFLVLAQTDEGVTCFALPRVLPDGSRNAGFQLQRLKDKLGNRSNASSEVEFRGALARMVGEPGRGVPTIIEMVDHTRLDCVIGTAAGMRAAVAQATWHAAHRSAFGKRLVDQPLMVNVLADLAIESEAATAVALRLARAYDEAPANPGADAFKRLATAVAKYHVCKRAPGHAFEALECLGGNGYVEASGMPRLYREAPLRLDLGGLGQRHGPRRPARAGPQPRGVRRLLRRDRRGRGRRPAARRLRRRHARGVLTTSRPSSRAPGASSSAWRCACRARCSCATRRPRWPMPSAPRAWRATRACTTARCRPAPTRRRSSRATRRRRRRRRAARSSGRRPGGPAFGGALSGGSACAAPAASGPPQSVKRPTSSSSSRAVRDSSWAEDAICCVDALVSSAEAETCCTVADDCSATLATSTMSFGDLSGSLGDLLDGGRDLADALGDDLDAHRDACEGVARLGDGARPELAALGAGLDDPHGTVGLAADLAHEGRDRLRGGLRLLGQLADLLGHDREAAALLAGARRLDGGVQGEQVRLLGDGGDGVDDPADALALGAQVANGLACFGRGLAHGGHGLGGPGDRLGADAGGGAGLVGGAGGLLGVVGGRGGGARDLLGVGAGGGGRAHLTLGAGGDVAEGTGDLLDRATGVRRGGGDELGGAGDAAWPSATSGSRRRAVRPRGRRRRRRDDRARSAARTSTVRSPAATRSAAPASERRFSTIAARASAVRPTSSRPLTESS